MTELTQDEPVLFVEDDPETREATVQALELAGIYVEAFPDAASALAKITPDFRGMVVTDIRMAGMDGLELFARVRAQDPDIPVILISGHADVPTAVGALREGAFDFLAKPFAVDHLLATVAKALSTRRLVLENRALRAAAAAASEGDSPLIGDSAAMCRLRDTIVQVARADIDVLVEGETGTGKELVALLLHRQGPRRGQPFVAVNCGALPDAFAESELFGYVQESGGYRRSQQVGRIEASHKGTLFLDEIDSMSHAVQVKLLRVLEEREVVPLGGEAPRAIDLRVVAASKRNLETAVQSGEFRQDLFYRLNVVRLRVPPLRERRSDIPLLFAHFVSAAVEQMGLPHFSMTDAIRRRLTEHDWPGNVRELRNFALSAALDLPGEGRPQHIGEEGALARRLAALEVSIIQEALATTSGNVRVAAELLGLPRKTLYDKLNRLGIDLNELRGRAGGNA